MNTMERIGFHLELAEAPWQKEPDKPVLFPAYSRPRPKISEKVSPLIHIGVVVRDVEDTRHFLHKVFGTEKIEKESTSPSAKVISVKLGNVVLQYYQPEIGEGFLYRHLKDKGPGVHHLAFFAENVDEIVKAIEARGEEDLSVSSLDNNQLPGFESLKANDQPVYMINTMENLGFQTALLKKSL
jgi:methylmalonyl-CoA/ethylmalonyl-CoA epimerase